MRAHTLHGARLLRYGNSSWVRMASEVAHHHHERWDGSGYPGKVDDTESAGTKIGHGIREREIPLMARIVSVADVFDALVSRRSYKREWEEHRAFGYIRAQAGSQFDPELTGLFLVMDQTVKAIRQKYSYAPESAVGVASG